MKIKKSKIGIIFDACNYVFMLVLMAICLYPMYYVLVASLSDSNLLTAHGGLIIAPLGINLASYKAVFQYPLLLNSYANTLFIVVCGVAVNMVLTTFGAYFLSRKRICLKNTIMGMIIFTMFFSGGMVPFYLTVKGLGLYDTLFALIFPNAINAFNLIIMRTAFSEIPAALEESAKIDGANDFMILLRIIIPVAKPTIAVIFLYYAVAQWNSWFNAMLFLKSRELFPMQLVLREILIQNTTTGMSSTILEGDQPQIAETIKYATVIVATLPILALYPFLQKYFVKGIMIGSVKG